MISPHFSYFLRNLSKYVDVTLIYENEYSDGRENQGWIKPNLGNTKLFHIQHLPANFNELITNKNSIHFFSGFNTYKLISSYFRFLIRKNIDINIISESPIQLGLKTWIRFFLYRYYTFCYKKHVNKLFAIGKLGEKWFKNVGFPKNKIYSFKYTVEKPDFKNYIEQDNVDISKIRIVYVGQLIDRKGLINLLNELKECEGVNWDLTIIGEGSQKSKLVDIILKQNLSGRVFFKGSMNNSEVKYYLQNFSDVLILPSKFDGWGAVISEALICGIPVITNINCGASELIVDDTFGYIYDNKKGNTLRDVIFKFSRIFKPRSKSDKIKMSEFFIKNVQDKLVADFLESIGR